MSPPFFGKYRGVVTDNADPLRIARIRATVPDVFGDNDSGWAMPCAPWGSSGAGFFALPATGAGVWIEFEQGDPDYPIWVGCWWGSASEMPAALQPTPADVVALITPGGASLTLSDAPGTGGVTLKTADGAKIALTSSGIEITNGQGATVKLSGPQVSVNDGALEVT
jgi:uncharacterized protein involved in type VI secretion and phage assembly